MREGTQRVNVAEEVIDEGIQRWQRAYLLGGELGQAGMRRRLQLGQGMGGIDGRLGR